MQQIRGYFLCKLQFLLTFFFLKMMSEPNPNILTDAWIAINIFTDVYGAKRLYFPSCGFEENI